MAHGSRVLGEAEPNTRARELGIVFFNRLVSFITRTQVTRLLERLPGGPRLRPPPARPAPGAVPHLRVHDRGDQARHPGQGGAGDGRRATPRALEEARRRCATGRASRTRSSGPGCAEARPFRRHSRRLSVVAHAFNAASRSATSDSSLHLRKYAPADRHVGQAVANAPAAAMPISRLDERSVLSGGERPVGERSGQLAAHPDLPHLVAALDQKVRRSRLVGSWVTCTIRRPPRTLARRPRSPAATTSGRGVGVATQPQVDSSGTSRWACWWWDDMRCSDHPLAALANGARVPDLDGSGRYRSSPQPRQTWT